MGFAGVGVTRAWLGVGRSGKGMAGSNKGMARSSKGMARGFFLSCLILLRLINASAACDGPESAW